MGGRACRVRTVGGQKARTMRKAKQTRGCGNRLRPNLGGGISS
jgi:hypothetical protein